jgi:DNA-binding CsgD family transcriptional regulator
MRIIEKLDVRNTAGIIVHAVRLGIIPWSIRIQN